MDARIDFDLNDIALLVRVVQARSFSAAARERGVPVSTVSRRIARLESRVGVRLLERTTRRMRLTDLGRTYFEHAERAVDELGRGSDRLRELQEQPRGRVRITAPFGIGPTVAVALSTYLERNPLVTVDLDLSERHVDLIAEGFDIAIRTGRVDGDFVARELGRSPRRLFASPEYLRRHGTPRRLADLKAHSCVTMRASESGTTWELYRDARKHRITFEPRLFVNELSAAKHATMAGIGIGLLPSLMCEPDVAEKRLVRVLREYEGEMVGVYLLYRAHRSLTAAVRTCVDHFLTAVPRLDPKLHPR